MNSIETNLLSLNYGHTEALARLTIALPEGRVLAVLGPNGAGKTTAIKLLMNLLQPSSGDCHVLGVESRNLGPNEFRQIGYVSENQKVPDWMTVQQLMNFSQPLYPTWDVAFAERIRSLFDLPLDRKIKTLSRGMQMKAALLSSIAYYPRLLVLDEPFTGLDPLVRQEFIQGVLELTELENWTILISSHDIDEVEQLADQVLVLDKGLQIIFESTESLQDRFRLVEVAADELFARPLAWPSHWLNVESSSQRVRFVDTDYSPEKTPAELRQCLGEGLKITIETLSMKDIYLAVARAQRLALI